MDTHFVQCPECDGAGETATGTDWIYEHGCGFSHPEARIETCPECDGTGTVEQEVWPVECDDDLADPTVRVSIPPLASR